MNLLNFRGVKKTQNIVYDIYFCYNNCYYDITDWDFKPERHTTKVEKQGVFRWIEFFGSLLTTYKPWTKRPKFCPYKPWGGEWVAACKPDFEKVNKNLPN